MRRWWFVVSAGVAAVLLAVALFASPASAASATGCSGEAVSTDADGNPMDSVSAPGQGGTKKSPFKVMYDGSVSWQGRTDEVLRNGSWTVQIGPGVTIDGSFTNDDGETSKDGTDKVSDRVPVKIPGLFKVDVDITGEGAAGCHGSVWVKMVDSPVGTPLWFGGLAAMVGGGAMLTAVILKFLAAARGLA